MPSITSPPPQNGCRDCRRARMREREGPEMNEIVIPLSRLKLFGQFVAGLVFVALGLLMMFFPMRYDWWERLIGLVTVAFFGAVTLAILYRLVRPAPAITINAQGITDNASGLGVGL